MKIERLELVAFGPFTEQSLDFSRPGAHLVHGPNEAGKSSVLRALTAWLFGIPERTRDDFLHPRPELLVGGTLEADGRKLSFYRRKKRKGDIVDRQGNPLDPEPVRALLAGLDRELFLSLHGIDHDTLVRGGRDILAHRGEIGQALFAAGAGLGVLHETLATLEAEKEALYKPRGQNQVLSREIRRCRDLEKQIRLLSRSPEEWRRQRAELERLDRELGRLGEERARLETELSRLKRLWLAAPLLARLDRIRARLAKLGPRLVLAADFSRRREESQRQIRVQAQRLELARQALARLLAQEERIAVPGDLLAQAARVEELFQRLGAIRKADEDRPRLEGMQRVHARDAAAIVKLIAPGLATDGVEPLLPLLGARQRLLALAGEHALLRQEEKSCRERLATHQRQLGELDGRLQEMSVPVDPAPLEKVIRRVRKAGDLDGRIDLLGRELEQERGGLKYELAVLGRWRGGLAGLADLALPPPGAVRAAGRELEEAGRRLREAEQAREALVEERIQVRARITGQNQEGTLPGEADLARLRAERNKGWRLLLRAWLDGEDVGGEAGVLCGAGPLHEWFWDRVLAADQVGDRLRFEAERVQALAALAAREQELGGLIEQAAARQERLALALEAARRDWVSLWPFLAEPPGPPPVMEEWRGSMEGLIENARRLGERERELEEARGLRQRLCRELAGALEEAGGEVPAGGKLEPLLQAAEEFLATLRASGQHYRELRRDRERAAGVIRDLEEELARHEGELRAWRNQWRELAQVPGRDAPLAPEEVQDLLDQAEQARGRYQQAGEFAVRLRGMDRDRERFAADVAALVADCGVSLRASEPGEMVLELQNHLDRARKDQALQERVERERSKAQTELDEARTRLNAARSEMEALLTMAGCKSEAELAAAEERSRDQALLHEQAEQTGRDLDQALAGMSRDDARQALAGLDVDALPARMEEIERRLADDFDPAIRRLAEERGGAAAELARMDGSDAAARLAGERAASLAAIQEGAARFVRLQLAVDLLRHEIEAYRQANQGPVLALASDIFSRLTLGSFSGLSTDVDNQGRPVLVGQRPGSSQPVEVAAMSTGSRDQLFLALRLAAIRHRADQGRAMFHILDDVLINFDEERCRASLAELARLGSVSQLILFTHQARVAEMAGELDGIVLHVLAGGTAEKGASPP